MQKCKLAIKLIRKSGKNNFVKLCSSPYIKIYTKFFEQTMKLSFPFGQTSGYQLGTHAHTYTRTHTHLQNITHILPHFEVFEINPFLQPPPLGHVNLNVCSAHSPRPTAAPKAQVQWPGLL